MLSATFHDQGSGADDPDFSVDISRSRANFRSPEILYIFHRNCISLRLMLIPVFHAGGGLVLISSWRCNFSIYLDIQVYYLDIQAITTLYAFYWLYMCCFLLVSHFSTLQPLSWKVTFSGTKKIIEPTVFNLQASDWLHCEEETGAPSLHVSVFLSIGYFFLF